MKKTPLILKFILVFTILFTPTAWPEAGDAHLFGGGDSLDGRIRGIRSRINQAVPILQAGFHTDQLCTPVVCRKRFHADLCHTLRQLNKAQIKQCRSFLIRSAKQFQEINVKKLTPLRVTQEKLWVAGPGGKARAVAAKTKHARTGEILLHRQSVQKLSEDQLMALWIHELGHKVGRAGKSVSDLLPVGAFASGRDFLDAVGAALAIYAMEHSSPRQAAPSFPKVLARSSYCALPKDAVDRFLVGLNIDVRSSVPKTQHLNLWRKGFVGLERRDAGGELLAFVQHVLALEDSRRQSISSLFQKYLYREPKKEELTLMLKRVQKGVPYEAVVASIMGAQEYQTVRMALGPQQFVVSAYSDLFGETPSPQSIRSYVNELRHLDSASVILKMLKHNENGWRRWTREWYQQYLNRVPEPSEEKAQLIRLRSGAGWEAVRADILSSSEYIALQSMRWKSCEKNSKPKEIATTASANSSK